MGLFDFIKSAGKKLGIGCDDDAPNAEAVQKGLASHGLGTDAVKVEVVEDKVVLKGTVKDQLIFENAVVAVGNTLGIPKVEAGELTIAEAPDAVPVAAKDPILYTVKKGDNLGKIAEAQYGKGKGAKNPVIFEANRPMLSHSDNIYPGRCCGFRNWRGGGAGAGGCARVLRQLRLWIRFRPMASSWRIGSTSGN